MKASNLTPELISSLIKYILPDNLNSKVIEKDEDKAMICQELGKDFFVLLFQTIQSSNPSMCESIRIDTRKLTVKLICELAYENTEAQEFICNCFNITPLQQRVAINGVPYKVQKMIMNNPKVIMEVASNERYWSFPLFDGSDEDFPDPLEYLIGFALTETRDVTFSPKELKTLPPDNTIKNKNLGHCNLLQKDVLNYLAIRNNSKKATGINSEESSKFSVFSTTRQDQGKIQQNFYRPETNIMSKKFELYKAKDKTKKHKSMRNKARGKELIKTQRAIEDNKSKVFPSKRSLKFIKNQVDINKNPLKLGKNKSSGLKIIMTAEQEQALVKEEMQKSIPEDTSSFNLCKRSSEILTFISITRNSIGTTKNERSLGVKKKSDAPLSNLI